MEVDKQITVSNETICNLIDNLSEKRGILSQCVLQSLRTLIEAVAVKASGETEYDYYVFKDKAKSYILTRPDLIFLSDFHKCLQQSVSHYLPNEVDSERLMLKYYEYLLKIKYFLKNKYNFDILQNINKFPLELDPAFNEYYKKIANKIEALKYTKGENDYHDRYYIRKNKPFFVDDEIYYEITFSTAVDNTSKFDNVIAFTKFNISSDYAVKLFIINDFIEIFNMKVQIQIIVDWETSIRPCELNNFAKIFGKHTKISSSSIESRELMLLLGKTGLNLVDVVEFPDEYYDRFKNAVISKAKSINFFNILDECRELIKNNYNGSSVVKYLLYHLNNKIIKLQYSHNICFKLSNLNLQFGCIPFDKMPFNTSLISHNPKIHDLLDCIEQDGHEHEFLARLIKNNTEQNGELYTPIKRISGFDDINKLIKIYNNKLWDGHKDRSIEIYKNHAYIKEYENDTFCIIKKLKELSSSGVKNYSNSVVAWLNSSDCTMDCDEKKNIIKQIFENSHVAIIYGSAGTGKTKLINDISIFHKDLKKLYLATTNPAVDNLKRRISIGNSTFSTIASFLSSSNNDTSFDMLIIDECSTINNSEMLGILNKANFKLLILVGDTFQIESILFGSWFGSARSFLTEKSVFELTRPYRTKNEKLLILWDRVRNIDNNILEHITKNDYSKNLDESIFQKTDDDEIILCLNYDGLYGINNINNLLQENNKNDPKKWGVHTYKIDDPVLFNDSNRFKPLINNNLKGKIIDVECFSDKIRFDIEIDKSINEIDTFGYELELLGESNDNKSIVRFFVSKIENTDEDDNSLNTIMPFQIAYAVSIHKAQGLEYNSVKIVITNETEEMITHNIFYTAITRAKEKLKIYWSPETEKKMLTNFKTKFNKRDLYLLKLKFNL